MDMRGFMTTVIATALMGLAVATAPTTAFAADHDGNWIVKVITERGKCDRTSSYNVNVSDGILHYTSYTSINLHGTVSPQGEVRVSLRHHDDGANGSGHLSERSGIGGWQGVGTNGACSGRWQANRR
jgi:hypothetical protein